MMLEYINEPVSVEGQTTAEGTFRPLTFTWQGRRYPIESWGRESTDMSKIKTVHCHLVQTAGGETWELCQDKETAQWTLTRHWAVRSRVV